MDKVDKIKKQEDSAQEVVKWDCAFVGEAPDASFLVGDLRQLECRGFEAVKGQGKYKLKLLAQNKYQLILLKTLKDQENLKTFQVTSHKVFSGDLPLEFMGPAGGVLFSAQVKMNRLKSSLKQGEKQDFNPPPGYLYFPPTWLQIAIVSFLVLFTLFIIFKRVLKHRRKKQEFQYLLAAGNYSDPYADLVFDLRFLKRHQDSDELFKSQLEKSYKKFFFRVLGKNIFFDQIKKMEKILAKKVPSYLLRSLYVLRQDYLKLQKKESLTPEEREQIVEDSLKILNSFKKYGVGEK